MIDSTWIWRELAPATSPSARNGVELTWDGTRALLFGGNLGGASVSDETWELVGDEWNLLTPSTPPPASSFNKVAWDGSRLLMVTGDDGSGSDYNETWEYVADDWNQLSPASSLPPYNPLAPTSFVVTYASQLIWDGSRFLIVYNISAAPHNPTWQFASGTWSVVTVGTEYPGASPDAVIFNALCMAGDRAVGGGGDIQPPSNHTSQMANTAEFDGTDWAETVASGAWSSREQMKFVWTGNQVGMFGGLTGAGPTVDNQLWVYDIDTSTWAQITATGTPPSGRSSYGMCWDGTRLIIFGGADAGSLLDDTWVLEPAVAPLEAAISHRFGLG